MKDKGILELAKKLKALAEKGVGGEKFNAERLLKRLMKRYDITDDDIAVDQIKQVRFNVKKEQINLFFHVYISVTNMGRPLRRWRKPPYFLLGDVTPLEELEIRAKFDFFWKSYQKNLNLFFQAFIAKNQIYPPDIDKSAPDLTWEDMERIRKIHAIAEGIEKVEFRKQIKG